MTAFVSFVEATTFCGVCGAPRVPVTGERTGSDPPPPAVFGTTTYSKVPTIVSMELSVHVVASVTFVTVSKSPDAPPAKRRRIS